MNGTPTPDADSLAVSHDRVEEAPREPWAPGPRAPLTHGHRWVFLALMVASALVHFVRLGDPGRILPATDDQCTRLPPLGGAPCYELIPLDEVHYVPDARDILTYGTASDERVAEGEGRSGRYVVHPPVGKLFIAAGIKLFGDEPFGWRFFGAVFGTLSTAVMYLLARRLWSSPWWAALAALLLTTDGLWFVQSRVAMLDIYAGFFVLAGVWMLVEDRDRVARGVRWWRWGAAVMFGAGIATKWSVAPYVAVAAGMALAWEIVRQLGAERRRITLGVGGLIVTFAVVIPGVYVASEVPWFLDEQRYSPGDCSQRSLPAEFACYQQQVFRFHRDLEKFEPVTGSDAKPGATKPAHPYFTEGWAWPWIGRPVAHHYECLQTGAVPCDDERGSDERASEVMGLPNPVIWWTAFAVLPLIAVWTLRRGDGVSAIVLGMVIAGWGPYLVADVLDRPVFLFYATPLVPFLVIGVVHAMVRLVAAFPGAVFVPIGLAALAVAAFAFFYPVLAAHPIPRTGLTGWEGRMWLSGSIGDCTVKNAVKIRCWI